MYETANRKRWGKIVSLRLPSIIIIIFIGCTAILKLLAPLINLVILINFEKRLESKNCCTSL